jgi:hypothetical protein
MTEEVTIPSKTPKNQTHDTPFLEQNTFALTTTFVGKIRLFIKTDIAFSDLEVKVESLAQERKQ